MSESSTQPDVAEGVVWGLMLACLVLVVCSSGYLNPPKRLDTAPAITKPDPITYPRCPRHRFFSRRLCPLCNPDAYRTQDPE
jgi:hypothetical protein